MCDLKVSPISEKPFSTMQDLKWSLAAMVVFMCSGTKRCLAGTYMRHLQHQYKHSQSTYHNIVNTLPIKKVDLIGNTSKKTFSNVGHSILAVFFVVKGNKIDSISKSLCTIYIITIESLKLVDLYDTTDPTAFLWYNWYVMYNSLSHLLWLKSESLRHSNAVTNVLSIITHNGLVVFAYLRVFFIFFI